MSCPSRSESREACDSGLTRRKFLVGGGIAAVGAWSAKTVLEHYERFQHADVFVARAEQYGPELAARVRDGLGELGWGRGRVKGKSVLLKPNLVEPDAESPHINTHPTLIHAVAEVFRSWDAAEVFVAEGPGHCRDVQLVLEQSGLEQVLREARLGFEDLNHDDVFDRRNPLRMTGLPQLYFAKVLQRADIIVSLPKLKTHHWVGTTLAMKNLFGVMPGVCYGWPKNLLHKVGIEESILDITATLRPHLAIVDGIVGMEGDGPIMGTPRWCGVLVMGENLASVDATAARLMQLDPWRIPYLSAASSRIGPIGEARISQRGEPIEPLARPFALPEDPAFRALRPTLDRT